MNRSLRPPQSFAETHHPVICLVTDRHRLADQLALDPDSTQLLDRLADLVAAAAKVGVDLVQVRDADLPASALADFVRRLVAIVEDAATRIVLNDRLDVALAAKAHGLHLKDAPAEIERIRAIAPSGFIVGQSIHRDGTASHTGADYVIFGTLFPTRSKPHIQAAGLSALEETVRATRVPVLGIGGVDVSRLESIAATGAAGIAAVELFLPVGPAATAPLGDIIARVRDVFAAAARRPV